jgi:hypothetical protein
MVSGTIMDELVTWMKVKLEGMQEIPLFGENKMMEATIKHDLVSRRRLDI